MKIACIVLAVVAVVLGVAVVTVLLLDRKKKRPATESNKTENSVADKTEKSQLAENNSAVEKSETVDENSAAKQ